MIRYLLFARILGIVVLSFTASFLMLKGFLFIPALFGFCILALSVFLYKDQQKTVKRMEYLIESIHYGDLSLFYPSDSMTEDEKALASSMNAALEALRSRLYSSVVAEAETEAWQKLIRVLTHEIMNSIAPVTSLSDRGSSSNTPVRPAKDCVTLRSNVKFELPESIKRRSGWLSTTP